MRPIFKKVGAFILMLTLLASAAGCGGKPGGQTEDFSGEGTGTQPIADPSAPEGQGADINAPLDEFLIGAWMAPALNVMTERQVLAIYYDGTIELYYATPGASDTEETWVGGSWELDETAPGTWRVDGNKLIAKFENDSISFETDVRVIDTDSIEIEVFYTRSEYRRLPVS